MSSGDVFKKQLKVHEMKLPELSEMTGIPVGTLRGYKYGDKLRHAEAQTVLKISAALQIPEAFLLDMEKEFESIFDEENKRCEARKEKKRAKRRSKK